jgi:hypothetical protein
MNKFRKLGFVEYDSGLGEMKVHSSLLKRDRLRLGPADPSRRARIEAFT